MATSRTSTACAGSTWTDGFERCAQLSEPLFEGLDLNAPGFFVTDRKASEHATHLMLERV
jgi:hypothetical protein